METQRVVTILPILSETTQRVAAIAENSLTLTMKMEAKKSDVEDHSLKPPKEEEDLHHFHVLAVDDSLIDQKILEKLLQVSSCKVTCVDSGDKALKYLGLLDDDYDLDNASSTCSESSTSSPQSPQQEAMKVNLIMTDYCMPGMSGYDLLRRVKLQGSSWKHVPVVMMSSEHVPSRINMCLEGGAEEFLLKPLKLSDLKKLQPYLGKSLHNDNDNNNNNDSSSEQESGNSDVATDNDCNPNSNNNTCITKRKAMSPQPSDRSRPKFKGLTDDV